MARFRIGNYDNAFSRGERVLPGGMLPEGENQFVVSMPVEIPRDDLSPSQQEVYLGELLEKNIDKHESDWQDKVFRQVKVLVTIDPATGLPDKFFSDVLDEFSRRQEELIEMYGTGSP